MTNNNFRFIVLMLITLSISAAGQSLKKMESYYDPLTKTRIHESYTTLPTPPYLKQGIYKEWDQSGVLMTEVNFLNGKKNGQYRVYFNAGMRDLVGKENIGKLYTVTNYLNDKLNGLDQMYDYKYHKPQVILQKTWASGEQTKEEAWYENGKPKSVSVINGINTTWFENGNKASETMVKNGLEDGRVTEWYENGQIAYAGTVKDKCKVGEAIAYYQNGVVGSKMNFDPATCKDMHTIQYYPTGKVKWEREGSNGHYTVNYFDSLKGHKRRYEEWIDDPNNFNGPLLQNGKSEKYFESGKPCNQENFVNGQREGDYKVFSATGEVISEGRYSGGNKTGKWRILFDSQWQETELKDSAAYYRLIDFTTKPWTATDYFITGEKQFEGAFKALSPTQYAGLCTWYFKDGTVAEKLELEARGGLISDKQYYGNGKLKLDFVPTGSTIGGSPAIKVTEYYENGKLKAQGTVINGNQKTGTWKYFDESGNLKEVEEG